MAGHNKSYTGPILKIYDLIFSRKPELDSRTIRKFFRFQFLELEASFLKCSFSKTLRTIKNIDQILKDSTRMNKEKTFSGGFGDLIRTLVQLLTIGQISKS